jgi:hypothetical protein
MPSNFLKILAVGKDATVLTSQVFQLEKPKGFLQIAK